MIADVAKAYVGCASGRAIAGDLGAHVGGVAAVVGHCYPAWNDFDGGKGLATSFGQCLYTFPVAAPVDLGLVIGVARIPGFRRPGLVSTAAASSGWLLMSLCGGVGGCRTRGGRSRRPRCSSPTASQWASWHRASSSRTGAATRTSWSCRPDPRRALHGLELAPLARCSSGARRQRRSRSGRARRPSSSRGRSTPSTTGCAKAQPRRPRSRAPMPFSPRTKTWRGMVRRASCRCTSTAACPESAHPRRSRRATPRSR